MILIRRLSFFLVLLLASSVYGAVTKDSKLNILILGDSITAGYGVEKEQAFPVLLQKQFHDNGFKQVTFTASGVSGDTSASGPGRLKWLLKSKPDVLILELGANDGLRGFKIDAIKANLKKTIDIAKANKVRVILVGVSLPPNYGKAYNSEFTKLFPEVAKSEKIDFIPYFFDKLTDSPKATLLQQDGLHPNKEGHAAVASELYKELMRIL